jgi:uncharacterized membrane protein YccC
VKRRAGVLAGVVDRVDRLRRVAEVLFGCLVGIAVAWLLSRLWPLPEDRRAREAGGGGAG